MEECFEALLEDSSTNLAAKAALEMALWDMRAQMARLEARKATRAADRAEAEKRGRSAWKAMAARPSHPQR